ncbi:MAG: acetyltransferase [Chromatiales bacterium]|nr:acetyltransferase [Chromatiales bacterium]
MATVIVNELAERIRQACIEVALEAYELGGISGLCAEGRWELAIGAIRDLDLNSVVKSAIKTTP